MVTLEFTIQYLIDYDWHRITAVYDSSEDVRKHAADLVMDGYIIRVLVRRANVPQKTWWTITLRDDGLLKQDTPIYTCPE